MKAISFQWTPGVEAWEAETIVSTIAHVQEIAVVLGLRAGFSVERSRLRPFGTWMIPQAPKDSPYWSSQWYVSQSLSEDESHVVGPRFLRVMEHEPWQQVGPHYDVAILEQDLRDEPQHNIAPQSDPHVFVSFRANLGCVVSLHRLRAIADPALRRVALRRLALHGFGRVLELPSPARTTNVDAVRGSLACQNLCAMRFAANAAQWLDLGREEHDRRAVYCRECTEDLLRHVVQNHFHPN